MAKGIPSTEATFRVGFKPPASADPAPGRAASPQRFTALAPLDGGAFVVYGRPVKRLKDTPSLRRPPDLREAVQGTLVRIQLRPLWAFWRGPAAIWGRVTDLRAGGGQNDGHLSTGASPASSPKEITSTGHPAAPRHPTPARNRGSGLAVDPGDALDVRVHSSPSDDG